MPDVVSLVGDEQAQALAIDRMLRQRLLPEEHQRRQLLCGNPGQFQGDERDKLQEDMERPALLERLGWRFVRVRGSVFFRDPDRAMAEVFRRLEELGIPPESSNAGAAAQQPQGELRDRVIRRAQDLRQEWAERSA